MSSNSQDGGARCDLIVADIVARTGIDETMIELCFRLRPLVRGQ